MAVRIVVDSTCDLPREVLEKWDVTMVPLLVMIDGKVYRDKVDLTSDDFFRMLAACKELPKTSLAPPHDFAATVQPLIDAGDEVLMLILTGANSGTYQSACSGTQHLPNVTVVDTHQVSLGLALLVNIAVKLRDAGLTRLQIESEILAIRDKVRLFALLDMLKYMKMGGRVSALTALFGAVLNIKPILSVYQSKLTVPVKLRGHKAGMNALIDLPDKYPVDTRYPIYIGHTAAPPIAVELRARLSAKYPQATLDDVEIGSVIGTHAGPNCAGIAWVEE